MVSVLKTFFVKKSISARGPTLALLDMVLIFTLIGNTLAERVIDVEPAVICQPGFRRNIESELGTKSKVLRLSCDMQKFRKLSKSRLFEVQEMESIIHECRN